MHWEVSFAQLFIGFFEPLCVYPSCCEFQEGLLFVSIVLCILNMDELRNVQRGVSHCRDSWSRLKNTWEHFVKGSFASLECCWWRASIWRRGALDAIAADIVDYESKVLGFASLCIKFVGFFCVEWE
jgi:hypothetical protein